MSETNDLADDGFHEIQLSGKQLVFLFMATTIVAVVIFLLGVQVGRGVKNDRAAEASDVIPASTAPPPTASTPSQPAAAGDPPAAEPPAPAQEPDELSYAKRLQSDSPPAEKLKPPPAAPAPQVAAPPASVASAPPPPPKPSPNAEASVSGARPGNWIVQVTAIQDRSAATAIAKRLGSMGYPAFVLDPAPGSPVIYRVQVGAYNDRPEAEQVRRRLEKDEQFKPIVRSAR